MYAPIFTPFFLLHCIHVYSPPLSHGRPRLAAVRSDELVSCRERYSGAALVAEKRRAHVVNRLRSVDNGTLYGSAVFRSTTRSCSLGHNADADDDEELRQHTNPIAPRGESRASAKLSRRPRHTSRPRPRGLAPPTARSERFQYITLSLIVSSSARAPRPPRSSAPSASSVCRRCGARLCCPLRAV